MITMASKITGLTIVYPTVYSGADQRKHQSLASLAFARGIHRWPVNSPHNGPVTRKSFHLMTSSWDLSLKWTDRLPILSVLFGHSSWPLIFSSIHWGVNENGRPTSITDDISECHFLSGKGCIFIQISLMAPRHQPNQCWHSISWTLENTLQSVFLRVQLIVCQHWFEWWLGAIR